MIKLKPQQVSQPSSESGFTIIESLVAMLVVAILLAAIAPTIVIATATRVQSKRVELATQAARTFIDGVKTGAVTIPATTTAPTGTLAGNNLLNTTSMPVPQTTTSLTSLYCVTKDTNNSLAITNPDCTSNTSKIFYIQAVRITATTSTPTDSTGLPKDGYRLAIRVYRSDIDVTKTVYAGLSDSSINKKQNAFTGTLGNTQSPLVEMTTEIGSRNTSFNALCQRLAITGSTTSNTTCN
ncbi:prepilin-type N-terminal cleavage/methylation domain-containing protein [Nostoc sp. C052]|uniref:hormogonium polysaccharide secretion pseudopilin HpsB n=1 Tax=Nostoc sp. C052 TaxID=2576902 RepID=UPI0015C340C1|nr:hormogonium polysaccharide secretion pseudopilin HpsB [Nostoc sp. C052]QLE44026.1 prepilin-type N-terminal cleavage/methylation domain-containing protein [Nostoc sp. C052]